MSEASIPNHSYTSEAPTRVQRAELRRSSSLSRRAMRAVTAALVTAEEKMTTGIAYGNRGIPPALADEGNIDYAIHAAKNSGRRVVIDEISPEEFAEFRHRT